MAERPDIGRMIDEELEGYTPPKPEPLDDIKDTRTPAERAASMDRAERERKAEAEIAGLREKWQAADATKAADAASAEKAKKPAEEMRKADAARFASDYDALKAMPPGDKEAEERKAALIEAMVEDRTTGNTELGTRFVKLGILYPEEVKLHAYTEVLAQVKETILANRALDRRIDTFLKGPAEAGTVIEQLLKSADKEIEGAFNKIVGQLETKYGRRYEKSAKDAKAKTPEAKVIPMKKPAETPDKKKAFGKATEPFFEDVKKMLAQKKPTGKPDPKKRGGLGGLIDKLTGKKAA